LLLIFQNSGYDDSQLTTKTIAHDRRARLVGCALLVAGILGFSGAAHSPIGKAASVRAQGGMAWNQNAKADSKSGLNRETHVFGARPRRIRP
jgi:hypothetical protein